MQHTQRGLKGRVENFFVSTSHCFVCSRCGRFVSKAWTPRLGLQALDSKVCSRSRAGLDAVSYTHQTLATNREV